MAVFDLESDAIKHAGPERTYVDGVVFTSPRVDSKPIRTFGEESSDRSSSFGPYEVEGRFRGPAGVCVNASGSRVYVCDQRSSRVQIFQREGKFLDWFGGRSNDLGCFTFPFALAMSPADEVVVSDTWSHRVQVCSCAFRLCDGACVVGFRSKRPLSACCRRPWHLHWQVSAAAWPVLRPQTAACV